MRHLIILLFLAISSIARAVSPYPELEGKASRYFSHGEWSSASAILGLMLDERSDVPGTYGRAIVANAMRGDTIAQADIMERSFTYHIPIDSIFSNVRKWSFHLGRADLYEHFLILTRNAHPWLRRAVDSRLLAFYAFRRNAPEMIRYSRRMLSAAPDNTSFLLTLANGQLLEGNSEAAVATMQHILDIDPRNYKALVMLGNWYAENPGSNPDLARSKAVEYLDRARIIRDTPFMTTLVASLTAPLQ